LTRLVSPSLDGVFRPTLAQELIDFGAMKTLGKESFQRMAVEELRCVLIEPPNHRLGKSGPYTKSLGASLFNLRNCCYSTGGQNVEWKVYRLDNGTNLIQLN